MDRSLTLLSAQIHFLDTSLALIHIPIDLYNTFVQPIIQLLLPAQSCRPSSDPEPYAGAGNARSQRPWAYEHPFVNVSVTPIECSIACSGLLAHELFGPVRNSLPDDSKHRVSISTEEYVVIQVDGEGLDAGQRVLELTSPLAMNGICIFFITTYFSDYILVPCRSRSTVVTALEHRGFVFSEQTEAFVNIASPSIGSSETKHMRHSSSTSLDKSSYFPTSPAHDVSHPNTPRISTDLPPSSIEELQNRTFATLRRHNVVPQVDSSIELVQCAGRKDTLRGGEGAHASSVISTLLLHLGLVKSLTAMPRPRFLSLTLTDTEPASILLERKLLANFTDDRFSGSEGENILLGNKEDVLVPITLDLRGLPMESTGIVCGVAGRLVGTTASQSKTPMLDNVHERTLSWGEIVMGAGGPPVEMSYLSTARAGTVIVPQTELERALQALKEEDQRNGDEEGGAHGTAEENGGQIIVERSSSIPMSLPKTS